MAAPVRFVGWNKRLTAAPGTEREVGTLHVHGNGVENISCWKLDPAELARVIETGEVWTSVKSGQTAPPIFISGHPLMEARDMDTGELTTYYSDGRHMITDARQFAILHHGDQKYGDFPYGWHLGKVVQILTDFDADYVYLVAGWGHDLEEDCWQDQPIEERREIVKARFGPLIESIIWCCTGQMYIDGVKQKRDARNAEQYAKIAAFPAAAPVKVADRTANMEACAEFKSEQGPMYLDEVLEFDRKVAALGPPEMRIRMLKAALAVHDYTGDTATTTRAEIEARLAEVEALITPTA